MRVLVLLFLIFGFLEANIDRGMRIIMEKEKRYALVIGNSDYSKSNFASLKNPKNDSKLITKSLRDLGFKVTHLQNADREDMFDGIDNFTAKLKKRGGIGFFFFAGHGVEVSGENYLVPSFTKVTTVKEAKRNGVSLSDIIEAMEDSGSRLNIAVLDACRNDPFDRGSSGLAYPKNARGTYIAYSAGAGQSAEDGEGENSTFSESLAKRMLEKGLELDGVFRKVRNDVAKATKREQFPASYSYITGEFYFILPEKVDDRVKPDNDRNRHPVLDTGSQKHRLYISTTPENAKIRIMNINPKYYDGIDLGKNEALVEVTKSGYKKYLKWHRGLKDNAVLDISLVKKWVAPKPKPKKSKIPNSVFVENGLMWEKKTSSNKKDLFTWQEATNYCSSLELGGYSDWRLGTKSELKGLLTESYGTYDSGWPKWFNKNKHKRNNGLFVKNKVSQYLPRWSWSSTITKSNSSNSWIVLFINGNDSWYYKTDDFYAVCVRDFLFLKVLDNQRF